MPSNLDGNGESSDKHDDIRRFLIWMWTLAAIGCLLILLYSLRFSVSGQLFRILGVGMLVAGAALLSGYLLGFIFAIPRGGGQEGKATAALPEDTQAPNSGTQSGSVPAKHNLFNGNLVEISDWLTKIIVGLGLVELHSIPGELGKLSYYLASGLQPASSAGGASYAEPLISGQAAGLAILIFYFPLGFLLGYVWTMIYLRGDLIQEMWREIITLQWRVNQEEQQKNTARRQEKAAVDLVPHEASVIIPAEALISADQLDEAMASIDEALKSDPQNGLALLTKARILKRQALRRKLPDKDKLLKQALTYLDQAIALLPDKGEPIYNKACYQALLDPEGLKGEVLENLKSAFDLNPALRQDAKADEDLGSIRQDADFIKLIS
jgi:hypothetical protein